MLKETNVNTGKGVMPERRTIQKMGRRTREEKNYRRKVVKDVLLNSLLKAVVVPAATAAAAELTPWHCPLSLVLQAFFLFFLSKQGRGKEKKILGKKVREKSFLRGEPCFRSPKSKIP